MRGIFEKIIRHGPKEAKNRKKSQKKTPRDLFEILA
jgi:hypothetical protein